MRLPAKLNQYAVIIPKDSPSHQPSQLQMVIASIRQIFLIARLQRSWRAKRTGKGFSRDLFEPGTEFLEFFQQIKSQGGTRQVDP